MGVLYLLYESASGYGLFEHVGSEEIAMKLADTCTDLTKFSAIVKLKAFMPFTSAENALEQINSISEGEPTAELVNFLELNMPAAGKKSKKGGDDADEKFHLGVTEPKLGQAITEALVFKCKSNELVLELMRGIRLHFHRYIKALKESDLHQAQLGLSHSYSRCKVKFNVHRVDNMIIQSIALLDQLDKDLNTFAMRVKEWYGWHFPELARIVTDNYQFAKLAVLIKNRSNSMDEFTTAVEDILDGDNTKAAQVIEAAKHSMGQDLSPIDMINIESFATRVVSLSEYRRSLHTYLLDKMNITAPNLSALIGELVGARLIAHAGSLTSLAKYPASTVQILGAEKALFRALKTKGNTPKYGLIFHSSFIGRAPAAIKGRISRYLANKCSIACRIDTFSDVPTNIFGQKLKQQVEDRLEFYKSGAQPKKNVDVMAEAMKEVATAEAMEIDGVTVQVKRGETLANAKPVGSSTAAAAAATEAPAAAAKSKKSKKDKKREAEDSVAEEEVKEESSKKSKKSKKSSKE